MSNLRSKFFTVENLLSRERVGAMIFLLVCLCYGYQTSLIPMFPGDEYEPFTAKTLPTILTYVGIGLAIILLVTAKTDKEQAATEFNWKLLAGFFALMAAYGVGLTYLGFVVATGLFLMFGFFILGERRKSILFGASFPFVIAFYLLLTQGLDIYLEPGLIMTIF